MSCCSHPPASTPDAATATATAAAAATAAATATAPLSQPDVDVSDRPAEGQVWMRKHTVVPRTNPNSHNALTPVRISKIVFLGTGSAIPSPGKRNTSSFAVILSSGSIILMDCGEATQHQIMLSNTVKTTRIDTILITHLHVHRPAQCGFAVLCSRFVITLGDHCFGIFGLLCTIASGGRTAPLVIAGPLGLQGMVEAVLQAAGGFTGYPLSFVTWEDGSPFDLGVVNEGIQVSAYPLSHRILSYGYVLEEYPRPGSLDSKKAASLGARGKEMATLKAGVDITLADGNVVKSADCVGPGTPGKKIALLQDTCNSDSALDACKDVDLLIHECTYHNALLDKSLEHGHSTSGMTGNYAARCNAKQLVLTHFSNRYAATRYAAAASRASAAADSTASSSDPSLLSSLTSALHLSNGAAAPVVPTASTATAATATSNSDVDVTVDDLVREASEAYQQAHPSSLPPVHGIVAAQDFLLLEVDKAGKFVNKGLDR